MVYLRKLDTDDRLENYLTICWIVMGEMMHP